jgi:hypothetical protein
MSALRKWTRWGSLAVALLAAVTVVKVLLNRPGHAVATVKRTAGQVQRDEHEHEGEWQAAGVGDQLSFGDAVRTGVKSTASVVLADGSALELEPSTLVRFTSDPKKDVRFSVDTGLAMFESTGESLAIATSTGLVRVAARSRVRITQDASGLRMEVSFGRASFVDTNRAPEALMPGDELVMPKGEKTPTVKRAEANKLDDGPQPGDTLPGDQPLLASAETIDLEVYRDADARSGMPHPVLPPPLTTADVTLRAGEYATVHHPAASAANVRLRVDDVCDEHEAIVEVANRRGVFRPQAMGAGSVIIAAKPGTTRYRVKCANRPTKVASHGQLRIIRDAAVRRVPLKPPTNSVDLDGRRYTVLYQNRLPSVMARYSKVPAGARSRVVVQSGSRLRTYEGEGNTVKIVSGQLEDGEHTVFLETIDGKVRSPSTTLRIAFDNAAPTASFDQRGKLERDAEGRTHVSGIVPQGARVSLDGQALTVDGSGRFSGEAMVASGEGVVALRVEHPRAGLHYYLRRVAGESATR